MWDNNKIIFLIILLFNSSQLYSQDTSPFLLKFTTSNLNSYQSVNETDSFKLEVLKFYVGDFSFYFQDEKVYDLDSNYYLIDYADEASCLLRFSVPNDLAFDKVNFTLGVDSITNYDGIKGGDLDPTKGMYWAWQSGYINFKMQGLYKKNHKTNDLEYHLGGFLHGLKCDQVLSFDINNKNELVLNFKYLDFLSKIDVENIHHVMSPGKDALMLMNILQSFIVLQE